MSNKPSEAQLLLAKAKTFESLTWLGLLVLPLCWVFCVLCKGKIREAEMYKLSAEEKKTAEAIRKSTTNICVALTGIVILFYIFIFLSSTHLLDSLFV